MWGSVAFNISFGIYEAYCIFRLDKRKIELQDNYNELVNEVNTYIKDFNEFIDTNNYSEHFKIKEKSIH